MYDSALMREGLHWLPIRPDAANELPAIYSSYWTVAIQTLSLVDTILASLVRAIAECSVTFLKFFWQFSHFWAFAAARRSVEAVNDLDSFMVLPNALQRLNWLFREGESHPLAFPQKGHPCRRPTSSKS
jgi:hypothetical protein